MVSYNQQQPQNQNSSKQLIYYTFPGQGRCKLVRLRKNEPFFKLYVPKSSMSKTFSSDIYRDGKLVSSLGNTCKLLKCAEKEKGLGVDWCIVKDSAAVKNLTSSELELLKNEIRKINQKILVMHLYQYYMKKMVNDIW